MSKLGCNFLPALGLASNPEICMTQLSSRRSFVQQTAAGLGLLPLSRFDLSLNSDSKNKPRVLCLGAHPDDPESGCGGTLARFASAGSEVVVIYLTRGEAGIAGKSHDQSALIRSQEAEQACKILNVQPQFAGQIDGDTQMNNQSVEHILELIMAHSPDIVLTHWPLDSHKDHQIASLHAVQTWIRTSGKFDLYFFEVCSGQQTMTFSPTDYVDISAVQEQKRRAVYCHQSQDPAGIYACGHAAMEDFRGRELGTKAAEAFIRMKGLEKGNFFDF
jgi:LmbE family N-acetylglucosaminyl deacetylase